MSEDKKWIDLNGSICKEDIDECINAIVEDNRFDRASFLKECGISHLVKKITVDHLLSVCRHKGYDIKVSLPDDKLYLRYYLEDNVVEANEAPIDDIPVEEKEESPNNDNSLDFLDKD